MVLGRDWIMADVLDIDNAEEFEVDDEGDREFVVTQRRHNLGEMVISLNENVMVFYFSEGIARLKEKAKRRKGRGHGAELVCTRDDVGHYESMNVMEEDDDEPGPQRCEKALAR